MNPVKTAILGDILQVPLIIAFIVIRLIQIYVVSVVVIHGKS